MAERVRRALASWDTVIVIAFALVVIVGLATDESVSGPLFWKYVALDLVPIAIIAMGLTLVVITGEIDLSVASVLGLTCTVMGRLWHAGVTSLPLLIRICLLVGAVAGAINGLFITV